MQGSVEISMHEFVSKLLDGAPNDMEGNAPSPAANHLFTVNPKDPVPLDKSKSQRFHHILAKLLYLCKDHDLISTAIVFLTTKVQMRMIIKS